MCHTGCFRASPALINRWVAIVTCSPITFWEDADGVGAVLPVAHHALLGFLDVALVEQSSSHRGIVACCVSHWSGNGVPAQLSPPLQSEVNIEARPAVKGQGVEERLHGVQDPLKESKLDVKTSIVYSLCWCFLTHHDEPCDEGSVFDIPEAVVIDVCLHLQVEEEALIDDVGSPAETSICLISFEQVSVNTTVKCASWWPKKTNKG